MTVPQMAVDDIVDPPVPPPLMAALTADASPADRFGEHEALLHGFCQVLQRRVEAGLFEYHKGVFETMEALCTVVRKWGEATLHQEERTVSQVSAAITQLQQQGLLVVHNPYQATISVISVQGYPLTITVAKRDAGDLIEALTNLLPWLHSQGYAAPRTREGAVSRASEPDKDVPY